MPWFKVDDKLHDHRKARAAKKAAIGVWTLAGSWASDNLTDGFVPESVLGRWGTHADAKRLVDVGLWHVDEQNGERGWRFHEWDERQPSSESVLVKREEARQRMADLRAQRKSNKESSSREVRANDERSSEEVRSAPTRPDPTSSTNESSVRSSPNDSREPDGSDVRSKPVAVSAYVVAREYLDRVTIADKSKVSGVVQQAMDAGYEQSVIRAALRRLAKDSRPVTPDTLRIEIDGKGGTPIREPKLAYTPPRNGMRGREGW